VLFLVRFQTCVW